MNPLRWRKMTWAILLFTALMGAWLVAGVASSGDNCNEYAIGSPGRSGCDAGSDIGTGVGITALFCVWFIGFLILSIIWFMTKPSRRLCPACGTEAKRGATACKKCGYDFAGAVMTAPPQNSAT